MEVSGVEAGSYKDSYMYTQLGIIAYAHAHTPVSNPRTANPLQPPTPQVYGTQATNSVDTDGGRSPHLFYPVCQVLAA